MHKGWTTLHEEEVVSQLGRGKGHEGMSYGCEGKKRRWRQCGYKSGSKRAMATDVEQHLMVVGVDHYHDCKGKKSR